MFGGGAHTTLGDTLLIEQLAHFSRERIPERLFTFHYRYLWAEQTLIH